MSIIKFQLIIKKIVWIIRNKKKIDKFINNYLQSTTNNETIGQSAEYTICINSNIVCHIDYNRINKIMVRRINKLLKENNILSNIPTIIDSCGYKNGSVDFKLKHNKTLSLKTLKYKYGKVCPQKVGQPTLKSWDKIWNTNWNGELNKNTNRWEFIKSNIHTYLNRMLEGVFCCDYLIIIKNCNYLPSIKLYKKENLIKKLNYFNDQDIIYSREIYEEKWNEKKQKYSEMSSTIKLIINGNEIKIGEFQFHKSSRQELKFRFWDNFIQMLF